jgi:hypothetical protein
MKMKRPNHRKLTSLALGFAFAFFCAGVANAQWNSSNAYGTSTGYGTVYGSYGLAATMQSMYNVARAQKSQRTAAATPERGTSASSQNSTDSNPQTAVAPRRVVRNHGVFRPDATVDTGTALADALADTPEEKALIKQIYAAARAFYEKEAAAKGWKNNIAGGLTFFTVVAMTAYHDGEEPGADAANNHYKLLNAALDETPDFAKVSNKDKQGFNNLMIGFGGMLLTIYTEATQGGDDTITLADSK